MMTSFLSKSRAGRLDGPTSCCRGGEERRPYNHIFISRKRRRACPVLTGWAGSFTFAPLNARRCPENVRFRRLTSSSISVNSP